VLGDLLDEAEALPLVASGLPGETTTTLLVCRWGVQKGWNLRIFWGIVWVEELGSKPDLTFLKMNEHIRSID
jgi:hypothetical protein